MDRNSITGLVLIGLILTVFSIMNQPKEEDSKKKEKKEETNLNQKKQKAEAKKDTTNENLKITTENRPKVVEKGQIIRLENEKLIVNFNSKGGIIAAVYLKDYKSYSDFSKKNNKPICLFKEGDAHNQLIFSFKNKKIYTKDSIFKISERSNNKIVFEMAIDGGKIIQTYQLKKNKFDLDYTIKTENLETISNENMLLNWKTAFLKTERLFSEQRRVSTICYNQKKEGFSYLSETANDYIEAEDDLSWVAYKQSYFSSILKPNTHFDKAESKLEVKTYNEDDKNEIHLKDYNSTLNLNFKDNKASFTWYFGPNDYQILKSYDSDYDEILNFGWGLFRWINLYAVQPIFTLLINNGLGIGIAILILTLILKLMLMPIQWKMFISSVKMRILKPQVDELNAKYPKKEDAMKKQMEMMALYKNSGASPLAGCIPMLIQMPILLAVFRFFPAAFELRQQPFLWAEDLSSYDSIYEIGFNIWPYGDHVSLFTLLMAAVTMIYSVMNSGNMQQPTQPGMPNMKVLMYIFPIMMIFFFNNYSAGLSYFYFISTLISILMMIVIKKFFVDEDKLRIKMAERKAQNSGKEKKKSRFQEKLEEMQRKQQEMLKNRNK